MSGIRDVGTLPLSPQLIELLRSNGFQHTADLHNMRPFDLSRELNISIEIANSILESLASEKQAMSLSSAVVASNSSSSSSSSSALGLEMGSSVCSAKDLSARAQKEKPIITFCKALDTMLGGGFPSGQITEICGLPGIGKTQLAIQLAIDVQIPKLFSGNEGSTIYIDSEGSFMPERAATMASALSDHLRKLAKAKIHGNLGESAQQLEARLKEKESCAEKCNRDYFLDGIHVFRVHDHSEQLATLNQLQAFVKSMPNVKLVVIDSIAFHIRQDFRDSHTRMRILGQVASMLNELAYKNNLAVVVINHVTTIFHDRRNSGTGKSGSSITPALGEQWSHCITNRIMLTWEDKDNGIRKATLVKSPVRACGVATFRICEQGIRDNKKSTENNAPAKRSIGEQNGRAAKEPRGVHPTIAEG